MKTPNKDGKKPEKRRGPFGQPALFRLEQELYSDTSTRIAFNEDSLSVWAWPSRGGIIVLDHALGLDFEFLGLDPVNLAMHRDTDQDSEDVLCQRLLLLGAKWFDSSQRRGFVAGVAEGDERDLMAIQDETRAPPSRMERRWVSVAHMSEGGFWVAEFDIPIPGYHDKHNLVPGGVAQVQLARSMVEKAEILKRIGAKFYASLDEYSAGDGAACLNAWKTKFSGELGPLQKA